MASSSWKELGTPTLGSRLAVVGGVVATIFGFVYFDSSQTGLAFDLAALGLVVFGIILAVGFLMLRSGAGPMASAGFAGYAIAALALVIASSLLDPYTGTNGLATGLDALVILVGSTAALAGGVLLFSPLGSLTNRSGLGRASAYVFLVGGVLQMVAGLPDSAGMIVNSTALTNFAQPFYGIAGLFFAVAGPVLLYLAVGRLRKITTG